MPGVRVEDSPAIAKRKQDITSWQEVDISRLGAKARKRFIKRTSALEAYFTSDASLDEIVRRYQIPQEMLLKRAEQALMLHEDGQPWGFRVFYPGAVVVDHAAPIPETPNPSSGSEETMTEDIVSPVEVTVVPAIEETVPSAQAEETDEGEPVSTPAPAEEHTEPDLAVEPMRVTPALGTEAGMAQETQEAREDLPAEPEAAAEEMDATPVAQKRPPEKCSNTPGGSQEATSADGLQQAASLDISQESDPVESQDGCTSDEHTALEPVPTTTGAVIAASAVTIAVVPARRGLVLPATKKVFVSGKAGEQRRFVRKRWERETKQHRQKRLHRIVALSVVAVLLVMIALPISGGLAAYSAYSNIRGVALDGVDHLLKVKSLLSVSKSDPMAALNATKLQEAQVEFKGAESDFTQLQGLVNRPDLQSAINQFSPHYGSQLDMAQRLVRVGLDVSRMGNEVSSVALLGANLVHSSPLATGSTKPLITVADVSAVEGALVHALYYIDDIQTQMSQVSLQELPISTAQKTELASIMPLLPKARNYIVQAQSMVGLVAWLLGVGSPRRFLVQTLDSAELRPSGGFAGQYGILQIQDGRVAPFTLRDVALLDYAGNGNELNNSAPPQYRSWMNFGFFGLRDSNLSGDYPTTARINMQTFQDEGGGPIDGNIELTPAVISHVLQVTGPIKVAQYNETITAQNLEQKLHYYQQDFGAIAIEKQKTGSNSHEVRKAFTGLLGKLLMDKVRHLPVSKLLQVGKYAMQDIKARDLEIYFTNPAAESWLVEHGLSGGMDAFTKQDGFMVVQANISISKASQYVHTTEQDAITLDSHGGATHVLTITLNYQQTGPVYGYDTYADYIRVYAPPNAQFISGDGFDTGHRLCTPTTTKPPKGKGTGTGTGTGTTSGCGQYNSSFPSDARYCPSGNYSLGERGFNYAWPVDSLGAPTAMTSDLPGHAMWGGLTETPKNCISTITVSWYVPHAVKHVPGQSPYVLYVQKQGGYIPTVQLTIDTSAIKGLKPYNFSGKLSADKLFALPILK